MSTRTALLNALDVRNSPPLALRKRFGLRCPIAVLGDALLSVTAPSGLVQSSSPSASAAMLEEITVVGQRLGQQRANF